MESREIGEYLGEWMAELILCHDGDARDGKYGEYLGEVGEYAGDSVE